MDLKDASQTIKVVQQANAMLNLQLIDLQENLDSGEFEKINGQVRNKVLNTVPFFVHFNIKIFFQC